MKEKFLEFYREYKSGVWGAAAGLTVGILIVTLGFFKALFLIICVVGGFLLGKLYTADSEAGEKFRGFFTLNRRK